MTWIFLKKKFNEICNEINSNWIKTCVMHGELMINCLENSGHRAAVDVCIVAIVREEEIGSNWSFTTVVISPSAGSSDHVGSVWPLSTFPLALTLGRIGLLRSLVSTRRSVRLLPLSISFIMDAQSGRFRGVFRKESSRIITEGGSSFSASKFKCFTPIDSSWTVVHFFFSNHFDPTKRLS